MELRQTRVNGAPLTSKTWYFQKDVGGQTKRILIGRYPTISAQAARQSALELSLEMGRGAGKHVQIGVPTLKAAMDTYLAQPKLRSEAHKEGLRQQFDRHLKDWLHLPLDEISKQMVVRKHQSMSGTPSAANHTLKYFRTVWNHARRVYDLPECPTMAIEWYDQPPSNMITKKKSRPWNGSTGPLSGQGKLAPDIVPRGRMG